MRVETEGPLDARIFIVGEAPGETEAMTGKPFVGSSGKVLTKMLAEANISRNACRIGNVAKIRPPNNSIYEYFLDKKKTKPTIKMEGWIDELKAEILETKPNVIIALGGTALWALCGVGAIKTYRGTVMQSTLLPDYKVVPTFHPASILRNWSDYYPSLMDLKKAEKHSRFKEMPEDNRTLHVDVPLNSFVNWCNNVQSMIHPIKMSCDIEIAYAYKQPGAHISWIGFSYYEEAPGVEGPTAINIKLLRNVGNGYAPCLTENEEMEFWIALSKLLTSHHNFIFHNAQFDMGVLLRNNGLLVQNLYMDTMLAAHSCWLGLPKSLGFCSSLALDVPAWKHTSGEDMGTYNALDCINTLELAAFFEKEIETMGVQEVFKLEMSEIEPALMMALQGIEINKEKMEKLNAEVTARKNQVKIALDTIVGREVNWNSPAQLKGVLYEELGFPPQYKRRKSVNDEQKLTTDEESLKKLRRAVGNNAKFDVFHRKVPELLLEYRADNTISTRYLNFPVSPRGRVHTSYNIAGTDTGRWSSSKNLVDPYGPGNLQNITESMRVFFLPPKGKVFVQADYVQAEAVVVAYLSNDNVLKQAFKNGDDIHKLTAGMMFHKDVKEITEDERQIGKTIRHAGNYSAGPGVVANMLQCEIREAKKHIETYHRANPHLRLWHSAIQRQLRTNRTLVTPYFCRKRVFLDRWGDDLFRSAYAFIPQSFVGDLLNESLVRFYQNCGSQYELMLQLHDGVYVACWPDEVEDLCGKLRKFMTRAVEVNFDQMIIGVDFKVGDNWGEMEKI